MQTAERSSKRVRYAIIGLGHIAQVAILPAFANASNSELGALITGDAEKAKKLSKKYNVSAFHYDDLEKVVTEQKIDAVFIALPNNLHRLFTERAAHAGAHVLCEKPMATSEKDCKAMISACKRARVRLMIAYRLHFAPAHLQAIALARSGRLGELRFFSSIFGMQVEADNIRTDPDFGGGPLRDLGVYCINAARYLFGAEPLEVRATITSKREDKRFAKVEEMASAILQFPGDRVAQFTSSFGSSNVASIQLVGTKGMLRIEPAYTYSGQLKWHLTVGEKQSKRTFAKGDQFAPQLIHFSDCVLNGKQAEPDGYDGLADVRIIEAILISASTGRSVKIAPVKPQKTVKPSQALARPPVREPSLVKAKSPYSGK